GAREHVKVLDFGIAKILGSEEAPVTKLTQTGWLMGTPAYMAPEQIESREVDARTDVYALGVIFDEMVTGSNAYAAATPMECFRRHLSMDFEAVKARAPHVDLSPRIESIVARCLAKLPSHRFSNANELLEALDDVTYAPPLAAPRPTPETLDTLSPQPGPVVHGRDPARLVMGGVLLACVVSIGVLFAMIAGSDGGDTVPGTGSQESTVSDPAAWLS
ncbi:MAG: protein kinase, partial [Myxococcales bacterium]|nr:protein kinase [Myxococcales bacterium]